MQEVLKKQEGYLKLIVDNTRESVVVQKKDAIGTLNSIDKNIADLHLTIYEQLDSVVENLKTLNDSVIETFIAMDDIKKTLNSSINSVIQKPESAQNTARAEKNLSQEENVEAVRREETLVKVQTEQADTLKKILEALTATKEAPKSEATSPLLRIGVLGTALALGLGAVAGYLKGYVKVLQAIGSGLYKALDYFSGGRITKFLDAFNAKVVSLIDDVYESLSKAFIRIGKVVSDIPLKIMTFFDDLLLKLPKSIGGPILNFINEVPKRIAAFIVDFKNLFTVLGETSKPFVAIVEFFKDVGAKIASIFNSVKSYLDDFFKIFKSVMPIFEKLALPLTVIMAIWDTVKGAIEGFEKEGIVGAIKGAISGLFNSLIGGLLDLIKGAVSWIAGALGFTAVEKALDSFSFQDIFKKVVDSVFNFFGSIVDWIKKAFENFSVGAMFGTLPDLLKSAISWVAGKLGFSELEKLLDSFSLTDIFNDAVKAIFGFMSDIGDWISDKINSVKTFLGFGDTKEKAQQRLISAENRLSNARTANVMGAIGINEQGGVAGSTVIVNGVADKESARKRLQSQGYREMSEEERKAYLKEREDAVEKARKDLETIEDTPTLSKTIDSAKESVSGFFGGIFDKAKEMWDSIDIKGAFESVSGIANEYIIDPVKSLFEKITGLIEEYITKPLQTFFAPLVDFFKAIPTQLAGIFEYVGIPEIKYKIPVINKEISIGPFYPFRPKEGEVKLSTKTSLETSRKTDRETGVETNERKMQRSISEVEQDRSMLIQRETVSRDGTRRERRVSGAFDTQTGTSSVRVDKETAETLKAASLKVDETGTVQVSNRAFRLLKNRSDKGGTIDDSTEILKEDADYQRLTWFDKRKVDVGYAKASELIKDDKYKSVVPAAIAPNRESNANVYDRSVRNEQMRSEPTQQAPVIVNAATTNVANNRQNVVAPVPVRNQDSAIRGYVDRRNVLI